MSIRFDTTFNAASKILVHEGFFHSSTRSENRIVAKKFGFYDNAPEPSGFENMTMLPVVPPSKSPVTMYFPAASRSCFLKKLAMNNKSV